MWWTGAALGFDLETDGKEPTDARIITAATVLVTPGNAPQEMELMLKPERPIPDEAVGIHGITTEMAEASGVDRETGLRLLASTIADLAGPEIPVVGHNVSYDLTAMDRELRRTGLGWVTIDHAAYGGALLVIDGTTAAAFPVIDTHVIDKAVDRYRPGSRKLSAVAGHYGVPMAEGSAHGATADVIAALRIAITIANRCAMPISAVADLYMDRRYPMKVAETFYDLGALSLPELHGRQVHWARDQAEGLREYFFRKGQQDDAVSVDGSWPLRTLTGEAKTVSTMLDGELHEGGTDPVTGSRSSVSFGPTA